MTDTAYLYQYFLENSKRKKRESTEKNKKDGTKTGDKEGKSDGKHIK